MNRLTQSLTAGVLCLLFACSMPQSGGTTDAAREQERKIEATTAQPSGMVPIESTARPLPSRPLVLGEGNCAPRVGERVIGTCINNRPCRGYGERDARGQVQCACFGQAGGCDERSRCDLVKKECVPSGEPEYKRAPAP